jgi:hypothetical protein
MWFWLILILAVVLTAGAICMWRYDDCSGWTYILTIVSAITIIAVLIMGIVIIDAHTNLDARIASNKQIYDSLVYQLENELYENDNDLGKKELYNQIQEWNKDLAYRQNAQEDFWNGIFYANIYDQFKYIELPKGVS